MRKVCFFISVIAVFALISVYDDKDLNNAKKKSYQFEETLIASNMDGMRLEQDKKTGDLIAVGLSRDPFFPTEKQIQWWLEKQYNLLKKFDDQVEETIRRRYGYARTDAGEFVKIEKGKK